MADLSVTTVTPTQLRIGQAQDIAITLHSRKAGRYWLYLPVGTAASDLIASDPPNLKAYFKIEELPGSASVTWSVPTAQTRDVGTGREIKFEIRTRGPDAKFKLTFRAVVNAVPGIAPIDVVEGADRIPLVRFEKQEQRRDIQSFSVTPAHVRDGGTVTVRFLIEPKDPAYQADRDFKLIPAPQQPIQYDDRTGVRTVSLPALATRSGHRTEEVRLSLMRDGVVVSGSERTETVEVYTQPGLHQAAMALDGSVRSARIAGLYSNPVDGRLYALVEEAAAPGQFGLHATEHPRSGAVWVRERLADGRPVLIPLEKARRPGLFFQGQLWLVGGDSCNGDDPGTEISRYDPVGKAWLPDTKLPEEAARAGHAVLAVDNEIWVIGGWSQNGVPPVWRLCRSQDGVQWQGVTVDADFPTFLPAVHLSTRAVWLSGGMAHPSGPARNQIYEAPRVGGTLAFTPACPLYAQERGSLCSAAFFGQVDTVAGDEPPKFLTFTESQHSGYQYDIRAIIQQQNKTTTGPAIVLPGNIMDIFNPTEYFRTNITMHRGVAYIWTVAPLGLPTKSLCYLNY